VCSCAHVAGLSNKQKLQEECAQTCQHGPHAHLRTPLICSPLLSSQDPLDLLCPSGAASIPAPAHVCMLPPASSPAGSTSTWCLSATLMRASPRWLARSCSPRCVWGTRICTSTVALVCRWTKTYMIQSVPCVTCGTRVLLDQNLHDTKCPLCHMWHSCVAGPKPT